MTRQERYFELLKEMGRVINPTQEEINVILSSVMVNDHNNETFRPDGLLKLEDGQVALYVKDKHFCVNPISLNEDGSYHLEQGSIGGCVRRKPTLEEQIKEYNETIITSKIVAVYTLTETIEF